MGALPDVVGGAASRCRAECGAELNPETKEIYDAQGFYFQRCLDAYKQSKGRGGKGSSGKDGGGKGFLSGVSQIANGAGLSGESISADDLVGGSLKVVGAAGGLAVKGVKAIGTAMKNAAHKRKEQELIEQMETANSMTFSSIEEARTNVATLIDFSYFYDFSEEEFNLEPFANIIQVQLSNGIGYLRTNTTLPDKEFAELHQRLLEVRQHYLKLQHRGNKEGVPKYLENRVIMNSVTLGGGLKYTVREMKALFSILGQCFGIFGPKMDADDKITLGDGSLAKVGQGFDVLTKLGYPSQKVEKMRKKAGVFQKRLDKLKARQDRKKSRKR